MGTRQRRATRFFMIVPVLVLGTITTMAACGSGNDGGAATPIAGDASADRTTAAPHIVTDAASVPSLPDVVAIEEPPPATDAAACNVRLASPPLMNAIHIPIGANVLYDSNPPSSGPHYPFWANFQEFADPVDDRYLVHSLEHGAVLLLYKCEDAGCPALVDALRAVRDALPADPLCDPSIRVRIVIAPRPANDVTVAAAAWGATYRADCFDAASLTQFITAHYAMGPENFCEPGQTSF